MTDPVAMELAALRPGAGRIYTRGRKREKITKFRPGEVRGGIFYIKYLKILLTLRYCSDIILISDKGRKIQ